MFLKFSSCSSLVVKYTDFVSLYFQHSTWVVDAVPSTMHRLFKHDGHIYLYCKYVSLLVLRYFLYTKQNKCLRSVYKYKLTNRTQTAHTKVHTFFTISSAFTTESFEVSDGDAEVERLDEEGRLKWTLQGVFFFADKPPRLNCFARASV